MRLRTRPTWILASGALALSLVGAPAVMAAEPSADDPVATVNTLLDTMIAKDFAGIATLVCAEKREEVTANFDLTQAFAGMPPGVDMQMLMDALVLETPVREITLVSNDGAVAILDIMATMTISLEEEGARTFITQLLESQGLTVTDEMVDALLPELLAEFGEGQDLSETGVEVILEDGAWLVCEALGSDDDASPAPSMIPMASPEASPAM